MAVVAAIAAVAGAAVSMYGQYQAGKAQAEAERANAAFYREQSEHARRAMMREYEIYSDKAADFTGETISQFGKGNVLLQGSPLLALGTIFARQEQEKAAILESGSFNVREAKLKAEASDKAAGNIKRATTIAMFGTALGGFSSAAGGFAGGARSGATTTSTNWMGSSTSGASAGGSGSFRSSFGFGSYSF
jgi:hypothetical protein